MGIEKMNGVDFLDLDSELDETELLIGETVKRFVDDKFLPVVTENFEAGTFPTELIPQLGELGLLGMHLEGYGCAGTSGTAYGVACRELERGDSGLRSFVSVQGSLCMFPIWKFGSEEQKQQYLPSMATGELIGCFGLTEPDHGSDPAAMLTTAKRDGDDWILNGSKRWITNGSAAGVAIVWARTEDGIIGFLVEKGTAGFETRDIKHKLSLRASTTSELLFNDCRIPESQRLPEAQGLKAPLACLAEARFGIAWGAVGAAIACYESALEYQLDRPQFGRPIAGFQLSQVKFADMLTEITKASLLAHRLGRLKDAHKLTTEQVSMGKRNNVRIALEIAREARAMLGANGVSLEYPVIRHMVNLESVYTYEGTNEIHGLILGNAITGLSAFRG